MNQGLCKIAAAEGYFPWAIWALEWSVCVCLVLEYGLS